MKKTLFSLVLMSLATVASADGKHHHQEGGHGAGPHWASPKAAAAMPNPMMADNASINRGKESFFKYCSSCHGAKAMGDGPAGAALNPKPTNLVAMAGGHPDGDFAWKIANGRGAMPAWKTALTQNQIWDLVNYIQNLKPKGKTSVVAMGEMDHSKMSMEDMQKMMPKMKAKAAHDNSDGHHESKPQANSHDKPHTH